MAEVGPVALSLLPGQRAQAQIGLCWRTWPMAGDDGAEGAWSAATAAARWRWGGPRRGGGWHLSDAPCPAGIVASASHRVQPAGGQRREPGQHLADERQIGIDLRGPPRRPDARQARLGEDPGDGLGMYA